MILGIGLVTAGIVVAQKLNTIDAELIELTVATGAVRTARASEATARALANPATRTAVTAAWSTTMCWPAIVRAPRMRTSGTIAPRFPISSVANSTGRRCWTYRLRVLEIA